MENIKFIIFGVIYFLLLQYAIAKLRPLRGASKNVFGITVIPLFVVMFFVGIWLSFKVFPNIINEIGSSASGSSRGKGFLVMVLVTPLPFSVIWAWYRILLLGQGKTEIEEKIPFQIEMENLKPEDIIIGQVEPVYGEAIIIRTKEIFPISEYFFIVINGDIVAALKPKEFTKINLQQEINEIGFYAVPTNDTFNKKYKYNSTRYHSAISDQLFISVSPDIFNGTCIKSIDREKAEKLKIKSTFVEQGARPNPKINRTKNTWAVH